MGPAACLLFIRAELNLFINHVCIEGFQVTVAIVIAFLWLFRLQKPFQNTEIVALDDQFFTFVPCRCLSFVSQTVGPACTSCTEKYIAFYCSQSHINQAGCRMPFSLVSTPLLDGEQSKCLTNQCLTSLREPIFHVSQALLQIQCLHWFQCYYLNRSKYILKNSLHYPPQKTLTMQRRIFSVWAAAYAHVCISMWPSTSYTGTNNKSILHCDSFQHQLSYGSYVSHLVYVHSPTCFSFLNICTWFGLMWKALR